MSTTTMLTRSQQKTYEFIQHFIFENGFSPTSSEIAKGIGIKSKGVAHRYVKALCDAGLISVIPNRHRNIQLSEASNAGDMTLPIIGRIAAGQPIEAIQSNETLNVAHTLIGANRYVLQVEGDSMIGDNICNGDYVICEHRKTASDGEIVVALIDNQEATLKRLQRNTDDTITLLPSNPKLSPMVYGADRVHVQGIYIGLLRLNH